MYESTQIEKGPGSLERGDIDLKASHLFEVHVQKLPGFFSGKEACFVTQADMQTSVVGVRPEAQSHRGYNGNHKSYVRYPGTAHLRFSTCLGPDYAKVTQQDCIHVNRDIH